MGTTMPEVAAGVGQTPTRRPRPRPEGVFELSPPPRGTAGKATQSIARRALRQRSTPKPSWNLSASASPTITTRLCDLAYDSLRSACRSKSSDVLVFVRKEAELLRGTLCAQNVAVDKCCVGVESRKQIQLLANSQEVVQAF